MLLQNLTQRRIGSQVDLFLRRVSDLTLSITFLSYNTMETIDSLLSITNADISEIGLMIGVLLEVFLGKLILVFSLLSLYILVFSKKYESCPFTLSLDQLARISFPWLPAPTPDYVTLSKQ